MPKVPASSSLDMLLLKLVEEGVRTLYQLREQAGLSIGATHPALARLMTQGLIEEEKEGARVKKEYRLTERGKDVLAALPSFIEHQLAQPPSDVEPVLRTVSLAWITGQRQDALELLARAAAEARHSAEQQKVRSKHLQSQADTGLPALYRWLDAHWRATRLDVAGRTLLALQRRLQKHSQRAHRRTQ